ncbi:NmrA family NAD(P)-binding protein [Actinokineospora auranticolor]|uniref:Uncharacterized protein YbjT (DUF2867 family) n=1 Tax=Actinokineospora auranticolor TaxID=155976 RepID=A0A2S6GER4_9PSEU|nr:NmrA family NAD(P)-binding protein [Actinokineospora auranticolor]PPK63718.1 uncharacterized protein YbjT (DUF2867 family) [Actinokineospora auranticolor]
MSAERRYLVIGARGFQGGAVARALRDREAIGFVRPGRTVPGLPVVEGDLADAAAVRTAFEGVTHASVVLPLVYDADLVTTYAHNVVDAARAAGVSRLVYNTNTPVPDEDTGLAAYETRRAAERVFRESGLPVVVLRPPVYLDNLFSPWNGPALVNDGVLAYPLAADRRVAWISHGDLAEATVAALDTPDIEGAVVRLGGPEAVDGPGLAAAFSAALAKEVTYTPLGVDTFEAALAQVMGAVGAAGVAGVYRYAEVAAPDLFAPEPQRLLGVRFGRIRDWVAARRWSVWASS